MALIVQKFGGTSVGSVVRIRNGTSRAAKWRAAVCYLVLVPSAMALLELGVKARSYTGWQVKIATDSAYTKARITSIDDAAIRADLREGRVVVVAGFQGVDEKGNVTTLSRGGSDTSAVALAAAL